MTNGIDIFGKLVEACSRLERPFVADETAQKVLLTGGKDRYEIEAFIRSESRSLLLTAHIADITDEERISAVALVLNAANDSLQQGCFDLDFEKLSVVYKLTNSFKDSIPETETFVGLIAAAEKAAAEHGELIDRECSFVKPMDQSSVMEEKDWRKEL